MTHFLLYLKKKFFHKRATGLVLGSFDVKLNFARDDRVCFLISNRKLLVVMLKHQFPYLVSNRSIL